MRHYLTIALVFSLGIASMVAITRAQEDAASADGKGSDDGKLVIVPLVVMQPGETRELLLSTSCTVGATRGGGFGLTEMRNGKPAGGGHQVKTYTQRGVTITVPSFEEGLAFAGSAKFASLKERNINPFKVTITASAESSPGLVEMHLVDATCSGHCKTDIRVLVVKP